MLTQRLSVRCLVGILSAVTLCTLACPSGAQAQNKATPADINPAITFAINNVPPVEALDLIFHAAEQRYKIASNTLFGKINAAPSIGMTVEAVPLQDVLRKFFQQAHTPLQFRIEKGVYLIELAAEKPQVSTFRSAAGASSFPRGAQAQDSGSNGTAAQDINPPLTLHLNNIDSQTAFEQIFRGAERKFKFVPATLADKLKTLPTININLTESTLQQTLEGVFEQLEIPLVYRIEGDVYIIERDPHPSIARRVKKHPPESNKPDPAPTGVEFSAHNITFDEAVRSFFKTVNKPYRLAPNVPVFLESVTFEAHGQSLPVALDRLLTSVAAAGLTYRVENGVYVISSRRPATDFSGLTGDGEDSKGVLLKEVKLVNATPNEALQTLFTQGKVSGIFFFPTDSKERITLSMRHVTLGQAVAHVVRSLPADWNVSARGAGHVYIIGAGLPQNDTPFAPLPGKPRTYAFHIEKMSVYDALKALFLPGRANYTLDPALREQVVTVNGEASTLDAALDQLLKASPRPLAYKLEDDIYTIEYK